MECYWKGLDPIPPDLQPNIHCQRARGDYLVIDVAVCVAWYDQCATAIHIIRQPGATNGDAGAGRAVRAHDKGAISGRAAAVVNTHLYQNCLDPGRSAEGRAQ